MKKTCMLLIGSLMIASLCFAQSKSTVEQIGDLNVISIQQTGANNNLNIDQGVMNRPDVIAVLAPPSLGEATFSNNSTVTQKTGGSSGNDAYIYQGGSSVDNGNSVTVKQYSVGLNQVYTVQYGENNSGSISQGMDEAGVTGNIGVNAQLGNENTSRIDQKSSNNAFAATLSHGLSNQAYITQSGNSNAGIVIQANVDPCQDISGMIDNQSLDGNYGGPVNENVARLNQSGSWNGGGVLQTGNHNDATMTQSGASPNLGIVYQTGEWNVAEMSQTGFNVGIIRQMGGENNATVSQSN